MLSNEAIIPFKGTGSIKLYQTTDEVRMYLKELSISYREEIWQSDAETIPNPWTVLIIDGVMSLFFAKNNKLFKMVFWEGYCGALPNGIKLGMQVDDAKKLDKSLQYDEWNEDYESDTGYWFEDDVDTGRILSISIYIKEMLDDDVFDQCEW